MKNQGRGSRVVRTFSAVLLSAIIATALVGTAGADSASVRVQGTLRSEAVTGPDCSSPVGVCFAGTFKGALRGTGDFAATSVTPTSTPDVVLISGDLTIHDRDGDLSCSEQALLNTATGEFVFVCEITSGTGKWVGASGSFQASGTIEGTVGTGRYEGKITK